MRHTHPFHRTRLILGALALALPAAGTADPARIVAAEARQSADGWTVSVTLRHDDTGWDDYADGWRLIGPDGAVLGTRVLAHPHVDEQPFTRSLRGVALPQDGPVTVESSTSVTGWSGARVPLLRTD